ncbi:DUF1287 domain-containing protein [Hyphomonas sp.]|jgi:uncharacterized protein YijF (DUF1287 family)|uniref:DUF1287 domain-containing protein n=1 Tax=Hyphomonas sp. TaxID=87 RepID=UPI0039E45FA3
MITRRAAFSGLVALPLVPSVLGERLIPWESRLIVAARSQIGITRAYDPAYVSLAYPNGDVPRERGVCTDVVVRAYRDAFAFDLQSAVHDDMAAAFNTYPNIWGLTRPDRNIDHRRVPNLETYLRRHGTELTLPTSLSEWQAGDIYTMRLNGRLPHIGIVSNTVTPMGHNYVIHNIGAGAAEDDILGQFDDERRFRFEPPIL